MKRINLAVTGCMGRMGKQIIKTANSDRNFKLVTFTESKKINKKKDENLTEEKTITIEEVFKDELSQKILENKKKIYLKKLKIKKILKELILKLILKILILKTKKLIVLKNITN